MARTKTELDFNTYASFPTVWEPDLLYIATDTDIIYRWNGSSYVATWWGGNVSTSWTLTNDNVVLWAWTKTIKDSSIPLSTLAYICNDQHAITDYTFDWTERRNGWYLVTTASNRTINISPDLFTSWYEVSICKWTNNANTVTLDAQTGNNINWGQTFVMTQYNEMVTLVKDWADTWKIKSHYYPISWTNTGDETTTTLWIKINWATEKTTPVDADMFWLMNSEASNVLYKFSWANIKSTLKTYFDSLNTTLTNKTLTLWNNTISWTKSQFNTACTDWDFIYTWDNATTLNMNTSKILGRTTSSAWAVEEISFLNTSTINFTYTTQQISAIVNDSSITEAKMLLADNTTNDVSTSKHWFVPKAPNDTSKFLKWDWTWSTLPASSGWFWTAMPGTPTRASNTTFTVTGDVTSYVAKWMIIKWTESSTIRCAMVSIPSTYSAPNTTITIIGDTMASIDASSLKYCFDTLEEAKFAYAWSIWATWTDVANAYYAKRPYRVIWADLNVWTAWTTNSTTVDINKWGTTMFTTKPTLATTVASSPLPFTADSGTSLALWDKVTLDIDAVQTTNAVDLYVYLYLFPTYKLSLT